MRPAAIARCRTDAARPASYGVAVITARLSTGTTRRRSLQWLIAALTLPALLGVAPLSGAADERPTGGRVPTVTRLVKLFLEREAALGDAIRNGDAPALASLLSEDFEMRTGARAATPVARAEWMRDVLRTRDGGGDADRMAVHDYGTIAVVSFTMGGNAGPIYVVDVWRGEAATSKLAVRYASPAGTVQFAIPGASATEAEIPKKY